MRLFCDQCGTELGSTALRADSKFCSICGKALSDFIKSQRGNFKTSPKGAKVEEKKRGRGRPPGTFKRLRTQPPKTNGKRARDEDDKEESEGELEVKRARTGRTSTPHVNADMDAFFNPSASLEEHQDSEDTEDLGKGKRIRKTIQRYGEMPPNEQNETPHETPYATRSKPNGILVKKNISSLEQILNSSPSSGQSPSVARAALKSPIQLSSFDLPAKIHVSPQLRAHDHQFKRETIAAVMGGSLKTTFPYPRDRAEGPTYACLKETEQDFLPEAPGDHGIILVKALPESLDKSGFQLFIKDKKTTNWTYFGKYKILHTFKVSREQWSSLCPSTKTRKISGTLRSNWGKEWCTEKGVEPTTKSMMKAFDAGVLHWQASVVQCIAFDSKVLQQLLRA